MASPSSCQDTAIVGVGLAAVEQDDRLRVAGQPLRPDLEVAVLAHAAALLRAGPGRPR